jgi:hypothetical protein
MDRYSSKSLRHGDRRGGLDPSSVEASAGFGPAGDPYAWANDLASPASASAGATPAQIVNSCQNLDSKGLARTVSHLNRLFPNLQIEAQSLAAGIGQVAITHQGQRVQHQAEKLGSGDSLRLFALSNHRLGIFLIDARGHDPKSDLLAKAANELLEQPIGTLHTGFHANFAAMLQAEVPLDRVFECLDRALARLPLFMAEGSPFFACGLVVITPQSRRIEYAMAGIPRLKLLRSDYSLEVLPAFGECLGNEVWDSSLGVGSLSIGPNHGPSCVVIHSDGLMPLFGDSRIHPNGVAYELANRPELLVPFQSGDSFVSARQVVDHFLSFSNFCVPTEFDARTICAVVL